MIHREVENFLQSSFPSQLQFIRFCDFSREAGMELQRAGGKSKLQVESGSTLMITNKPVWTIYFTLFLKGFSCSNSQAPGIYFNNSK